MLTVLVGDAITQLTKLPDQSVQSCVTSPPYWNLRDYGTATWEGGDAACAHEGDKRYYTEKTAAGASSEAFSEAGPANAERLKKGRWREVGTCVKCGAVKNDRQMGLERTPEEYVANMVQVFREVRRVLANDGTLWLNIGDSYAASGRGGGGNSLQHNALGREISEVNSFRMPPKGYKQKDLVGIPWMVAFALRADGWYLRSDIIWAKPNCMPESVRDRPTRSHEYIFLLSKQQRYFYDADAIKEPASESDWESRLGRANLNNKLAPTETLNGIRPRVKYTPNGKDKQRGHSRRHEGFNARWDHMEKTEQCSGRRNKRDVWRVAPACYKEAHFATFPPKLITPCILAGSREGDTILDPFGGSGTTGMVALELKRKAVLIELNPDYVPLIEKRCAPKPPPVPRRTRKENPLQEYLF